MSDPRQARRGGFRAFAAVDYEQQVVREALADALSHTAAPPAETPAAPTATPPPRRRSRPDGSDGGGSAC